MPIGAAWSADSTISSLGNIFCLYKTQEDIKSIIFIKVLRGVWSMCRVTLQEPGQVFCWFNVVARMVVPPDARALSVFAFGSVASVAVCPEKKGTTYFTTAACL